MHVVRDNNLGINERKFTHYNSVTRGIILYVLHFHSQDEDWKKPSGTFDVARSLSDAGTDVSRETDLKKLFPTKMEVFEKSRKSRSSLSEWVTGFF